MEVLLSVRQVKPGQGGCDVEANAETLQRSLAGSESCPAKAGPQPEASLARRRVTVAVKRRQRAHGPRDGAPKVNSRVSTSLTGRKAASSPRTGQGEADPPGSESGARARRSPRNLGGLLPSVEATALVQR